MNNTNTMRIDIGMALNRSGGSVPPDPPGDSMQFENGTTMQFENGTTMEFENA